MIDQARRGRGKPEEDPSWTTNQDDSEDDAGDGHEKAHLVVHQIPPRQFRKFQSHGLPVCLYTVF